MTSKMQQLEQELAQLKNILAAAGIGLPRQGAQPDKARADYIEHGSDAHAVLLGLVEATKADEALYTVIESKGRLWRLEDEITGFVHAANPKQAAMLTLRQKINELEAGKPPVPDTALPPWTPVSREGETWARVALAGG